VKFQLVLQFPVDSTDDFDRLLVLEGTLVEELGTDGIVDGYDFGSGEIQHFCSHG
jgi:hypothetical protein